MSGSLRHWCAARTLPRIVTAGTSRPLTFSFLKHYLHRTSARCISSSLFISDRHKLSSHFVFNHDFEDRLKNKENLKRNIELRGCDIDIDKLEEEFKHLCDMESHKEDIEKQRKAVALKMANLVKDHGKVPKSKEQTDMKKALIDRGKKLKEKQKELMPQFWDLEEQVMLKILQLPSDLLDNVTNEEQILEEGFQENRKEKSVTHIDMITSCKDIKLSNVGDRAYYLSGNLAIKEQELLNKFSTDLREYGFTTVLAPEMYKTPIAEAGGLDVTSPESVYRIRHKPVQREVTDWDADHTFLRGSSHLSFLAFLARLNIYKDCLPLKMFVVGRCYSPGDDSLPGLYGITQSNKINICGMSDTTEGCVELMHEFKTYLTTVYKQFQLPYRLVSVPANSLQRIEQNRIELQIWVPSLLKYIKVASLSACADFSSRLLMIMCHDGNNDPPTPVHMVFGEFADITRLITILLEYDQIK